ncbi:hypothetical protein ACIRBX_03435 [Kitasatospora sp. NPDC096147]|uniref:DUF7848 domain-containing protein n=1 Tax=Kitasatospora sp. NPDC096147 TaxID=3364093 RepID=UPI003815BE18
MSTWTLAPDREPDALPSLHLFQCASEGEDGSPCGWRTLPSTRFEDARSAAFDHLTTHPEHRTYQHVASLPWRMTPDTETDPGPVLPLTHTTCHPTPEPPDA